MTSSILKRSNLKRRVFGAQESKHCKLGNRLEISLVNNLTKDSRIDVSLCKIHGVIEDVLAKKRNDDVKKSSM